MFNQAGLSLGNTGKHLARIAPAPLTHLSQSRCSRDGFPAGRRSLLGKTSLIKDAPFGVEDELHRDLADIAMPFSACGCT